MLRKSSSTDYDAEWGEPYQVYLYVTSSIVAPNGIADVGRVLCVDPTSADPAVPFFTACDPTDPTRLPVGIFAGGTPANPEIITHGILYGIDTSSFTVGDKLYAGANGVLTSTAPDQNAFHVATVLTAVTDGKIFVNINNVDSSFEGLAQNKIWVGDSNGLAAQVDAVLTSLTDVSSSMSPSNGEILRYQSGEWNSSSLTLSDTGLAQLTAKHIYVGDSNNETVSTDVLNVDVVNNKVGIVEAAPTEALGVYGRMQLGDVTRSVMIGGDLPASSGNLNVVIGFEAASLANSFSNTVAIGAQAALKQTGSSNIAIGVGAMEGPSGAGNTASGDYNIAIGHKALEVHDSGGNNMALGPFAFRNLQGGFNNVAIGNSAGYEATIVSASTLVGALSGYYTTGGQNTLIGSNAGLGQTGDSTFEKTVAVGSSALALLTIGEGNTAVGFESFGGLTTGSRNTSLGYRSGSTNTAVNSSTAIGYQAAVQTAGMSVGAFATGLSSATALGYQAVSGFSSVAVGRQSQTASNAVSIGNESVSRNDSVSVGYKAGNNLGASSQGGNTLVGWSAGRGDSSTTSQYNNNTAIGWSAGRLLDSGSGNVLIGYAAGQSLTDESNQLHINNSIASSGAPLIYGEFDNQYVKINGSLEVTSSGKIGTTLEVVGDIISTNDEDITLMPDGIGHVVMGNYEFDVDQVVGQTTDEYVLAYDDSDGTIRLKENIIEVTGATSVTTPIQNDELVVIPAGTPVYAKGETAGGARTLVGIADASNPNKMPAIGIAATDLQPNGTLSDGDAIVMGDFDVTISLPYSGLEPNDVLYVAVGGGLPTQTKPTGESNLIQNIGVVLKTNGAPGTQCKALKVSCIGRSNDVPNIAEGNAWVGNSDGVATPTTLADVALSGDYDDLINTPTDEHIGNTNLTIVGGDRILDQDSNSFKLQGDDSSGSLVTMLNSAPNPGASQDPLLTLVDNSVILTPNLGLFAQSCNFSLGISTGTGAFNSSGGSVSFNSTAVTSGGPSYATTIRAAQGMTGNVQYRLPSTYPSAANQVLSSTTVGDMSWATPVDTNTNIGNSNLSLTSARTLTMGHNLSFQDSTNADKLKYFESVDLWQVNGAKIQFFAPAEFYTTPLITTTSGPGALDISGSSGLNNGRVRLAGPSGMTSTVTFTLPAADGTPGQFLSTDGSGNLSFATGGTGTGDNLANADLTQTAAQNRTYTLADSTFLSFQTSIGTGPSLIRLVDEGSQTNDKIIFQGKAENIKIWGNDGAAAGGISFREAINNGNAEVTIKAAASMGSNYTLTLPDSDGSPNQVLKTDGSGNLDWVDQTAIPTLNITRVAGTGGLGEVPFYSSNNLVLDSDSTFKFSGGSLSTPKLNSDQIPQVRPSSASAVGTYGANSETMSKIGANVSVVAGKVYNLAGGSFTETDAEAEADSKGLLAVASATGTTNGTDMVLKGAVKLSTNAAFSGASIGDPVYLRGADGSQFNKGTLTATPPSTPGDIVRIVGYVTDPANGIVYFNPDSTFIEV